MSPAPPNGSNAARPVSGGPIPQWTLERYALGELPPDQTRVIRQQIADDPAAAAQLRELESDDRAIRMRYPAGKMAEQIRSKAGVVEPRRRVSRWAMAAPVLAMAAALMLVVLPGIPDTIENTDIQLIDDGGIIAKGTGDAILRVVRQADDAVLDDGALVAAGDILGFRYNAAGARHGVLLSVDGNGVVTLHFPPEMLGATMLESGTVTLDLAYELDDAPEFERFFLVTADTPIDVGAVIAAARALVNDDARDGDPTLPEGAQWTDLLLRKRATTEAP